MSWTWWIGLLAFTLQKKKHLLSYHKLFLFSLELFWKNYEKRSVEWGGSGRDGMSGSLGRIFSLKKRWKKNGSQGLFTCWSMIIDGHLTDWNQLNKPLILWNQTYMQFEIKKKCATFNVCFIDFRHYNRYYTIPEHFLLFFLTLQKPFSMYKIGMAKELSPSNLLAKENYSFTASTTP